MLFINLTENNEFNAHNDPTHATNNQLHLVFIFLSLQPQVVKRLVIFGRDVAVDSRQVTCSEQVQPTEMNNCSHLFTPLATSPFPQMHVFGLW